VPLELGALQVSLVSLLDAAQRVLPPVLLAIQTRPATRESQRDLITCTILRFVPVTSGTGVPMDPDCPFRQAVDRLLRRKIDERPPGKGNSTSHEARPDHLIITMIKWIRTSRLSIENSLSRLLDAAHRVIPPVLLATQPILVWVWGVRGPGFGVWGFGFRVWNLEFRVSGLEFGVSGFGFGTWGFAFRVLEFQVSGFGYRGFRFRVWGGSVQRVLPQVLLAPQTHPGVGFRVLCLGFRV